MRPVLTGYPTVCWLAIKLCAVIHSEKLSKIITFPAEYAVNVKPLVCDSKKHQITFHFNEAPV